jgi:NitT/TauT family transport system permease protein
VRFYLAHQRLILGIVGILMVLVPWETVVRLGMVKSVLISSPTAVAAKLIRELATGAIWDDLGATLFVWALGLALAAPAGILLGLAVGWYKRAAYVAMPILQLMYAAPKLAFIPMFILWFGLGLGFKVFVVFIGEIFFITLNTAAGVHATEGRFLAVARTYGASQALMFRTIVLPGSVPYIITGLRLACGQGIVGVVVAEFISSNQGIGFIISTAGATLNTSLVMVGVLLLATFGIVTTEVLRRVERHFEVWRRDVHG